MEPDSTALMADAGKALLAFLGVVAAAWIGQKAARRNAKAAEKTSELESQLRPLKEVNEAWERLNKPLIDQVARLAEDHSKDSDRIKSLETALHVVEGAQRDLKHSHNRALDLLIAWATWIDDGALPPPPNIPPWLREHMTEIMRRLATGSLHLVEAEQDSRQD